MKRNPPASPAIKPRPLVAPPRNWLSLVNKPQTESEMTAIERSMSRGTPLGNDRWTARIAKRLDLQSTLIPRSRSRKYPETWNVPLHLKKP